MYAVISPQIDSLPVRIRHGANIGLIQSADQFLGRDKVKAVAFHVVTEDRILHSGATMHSFFFHDRQTDPDQVHIFFFCKFSDLTDPRTIDRFPLWRGETNHLSTLIDIPGIVGPQKNSHRSEFVLNNFIFDFLKNIYLIISNLVV